jgi:hypothetical protein
VDDDDRGLPWDEPERKSMKDLAAELVGFLQAATGRKHWGPGGGAQMQVMLGKLVVKAEPPLQETVVQLIEKLRP